jgi:anti-sigma factor RsiW
MNDHVFRWLDAYHDGELTRRRVQKIEDHLSTCDLCRDELNKIQTLSAILAEAPKAKSLKSPEVFVAQVSLRIPRNKQPASWQRAFRLGWQLTPIGILFTWAFLQAGIIVTGIINLSLRALPESNQIKEFLLSQSDQSIFEIFATANRTPIDVGTFGLDFLEAGSLLSIFPTLSMGLTILTGMLYLSWLASWWIQQTNGNNNYTISAIQTERSKS